eukprot:3251728-Rhodomonas_salina.2
MPCSRQPYRDGPWTGIIRTYALAARYQELTASWNSEGLVYHTTKGYIPWREIAGNEEAEKGVKVRSPRPLLATFSTDTQMLGWVQWGSVKGSKRAIEKVLRSYSGDVCKLVDVSRQTLLFNTIADLDVRVSLNPTASRSPSTATAALLSPPCARTTPAPHPSSRQPSSHTVIAVRIFASSALKHARACPRS